MRFELFIAKRYFFSGKRKNIINIITSISVGGVAIGTMALIIVLSVFNGFDSLIRSLFGSFDSDLKVELVVGKSMPAKDTLYANIERIEGIEMMSAVYEDNALIRYDDKTHPARLKGVSADWWKMSHMDTMMVDGSVFTKYDSVSFCVVGRELSYHLGLGLHFVQAMKFYAPRKSKSKQVQPENAFVARHLFATGIFAIQSDIDSKYVIIPISFVTELFQAEGEATAFEIKVKKGFSVDKIQKTIESQLGSTHTVKNRFQQHEFLYKVMQTEKWIIFSILTFILVIASFSIIGSLMMLIIDKKQDAKTLRTMGAELKTIRRLFLIEGMFITIFGSLVGISLGGLVCWAQQQFGLVKINVSGGMLIDAYPVEMVASDFLLIFVTVGIIGYLASYYPVHYITKRFFGTKR
ncbi:MAG: FtsX-like permease family protein [Salinivirgaceae bacterium]|nr:FtsX-like permease family protein [Salinivirgaceae bacterium]